ncbi:DUF732 domain-containing protein [Mycobacterium sp. ENV421]|uniref:DUF732 domain-containing protein n=1 Tax=Mycobacterium sp. ENV421 TaxID=1213407 RepID=UPI001304C8C9|nr:DUF732 domain-containing protein [Mycobacterium sp. ENV421]
MAFAVSVTAALTAPTPVAHAQCSDDLSNGPSGYLSWLCNYSTVYSQHSDAEWLDLGHEVCQELAGGAKQSDLIDRLMNNGWDMMPAEDLVDTADVYLCPRDDLGYRKGF